MRQAALYDSAASGRALTNSPFERLLGPLSRTSIRCKDYRPGDVLTESRDVVHWAENKSGGKVTLIGIDIVKP
jgi:hypothetical protein